MIDQELDQLSRALIAATDRLNSEDFRARQARYIALEQEFIALGNELEAEEKAVEAAQAALTSYVNGNYLDLGGVADEATESDDELFGTPELNAAIEDAKNEAYNYTVWMREQSSGSPFCEQMNAVQAIPTDDDEYATAKANGALS